MEIVYRRLSDLVVNPDNPRKSTKEGIKALAESIKNNPDFFEARPILLSDRTGKLMIIGGERRSEAAKVLGLVEVPTILLQGLTEEREKEIMIRDNTHSGVWDEEKLREWNDSELKGWGVELKPLKETAKLSELKYDPMYFVPEDKTIFSLESCLNFDKFNAKMAALEEYDLTKKEKELLKNFVYRFIRIDFQRVAEYYAFHASEEMQKAMERLRLVLVDDGSLGGFIEDDLLRINEELKDDDND